MNAPTPRTRRLTFPGGSGHPLAARLELPADGEPHAYAILAHCFTCGKQLSGLVRLGRELTRARFGVLRFDFTGLGESEGEFSESGFASTVADLVAAADYVRATFGTPALLVGHSLGGTAALCAAGAIGDLRAVATINAPFQPAHTLRLLDHARPELEREGSAEVRIADRPFVVRRELLEELEHTKVDDAIAAIGRPLLIIHAPDDQEVAISEGERIFAAARQPKSFIAAGRDHLLMDRAGAQLVGRLVADWASTIIPPDPVLPAAALPTRSGVVVRLTSGSGFTTEIMANGHTIIADEPAAVGGSNEGPTPYDLLVGALGACTAMTLSMYAKRKGWPLTEVMVALAHSRVHAEDEARCENEPVRLDRVEREIILEGPLDDEQRARLLEIADRCPVHRTLDAGVIVVPSGVVARDSE